MKVKKARTQEIQTLATIMPPKEPPFSTDYKLVTLGPIKRPSVTDLQRALDVIVALQADNASNLEATSPGDIFLYYDIKLVTRGEPVYHHRGRKEIKDILTVAGISGATEVFDMTLLDLIRPLKTRAMGWINRFLDGLGLG
jgi:hypothetical protein